jgi:hypothetical protein
VVRERLLVARISARESAAPPDTAAGTPGCRCCKDARRRKKNKGRIYDAVFG